MRVLVAYDGSDAADGAVEDLNNAGLPESGQMHVLKIDRRSSYVSRNDQ